MTRNDMVAALLAAGWSYDDDGDLQSGDSRVLLSADGASVACTHRAAWPHATLATPAEALAWALDFARLVGPVVRLA
mgnify:CR=1 FL=1